MIYTRILAVLSFVFILFFTSCKDPNEYRIDPAFTGYLQRFENEAASHGRNFDLTKTGLIIEFGTLKDGTAGLTHYENPIRIQIDKPYWTAISSTAGADQMKEDLLFHELGHGLLGRKHLNTILENGDWKSIMCGGDKVNNRPWNINYKGMRRTYYINELFEVNTPAPDFSSKQLVADTTGYIRKLYLSFNSAAKSDAGWPIVDTTNYKTSIDNGRLCFESKISNTYYGLAQTPINVQSNFSFELTLEYPIGTASDQYGIVFGSTPSNSIPGITQSIEYFSINNSQNMFMGNSTWYSFFTQLTESQILPGLNNTLKVTKIGNMLYYFINNVYAYQSEIEDTQSGFNFGFMIPPKGKVWMDNLSVSVKGTSGVSRKVIPNQSLEFKFITPESPVQHVILNK